MVFLMLVPALADWQTTLEVAGFTIGNIQGTMNPDGSGTAIGRLIFPGGGSNSVDLASSSAGVVTGSTRASFTLGGVRVDGSFLLNRLGLQGSGAIHTQGKPISDADMVINPKTGVNGKGNIRLGSDFFIPVDFDINSQGITVSGSNQRQVSIDTPLAMYTFKGDIKASTSAGKVKLSAAGNIERKGKIGGMVSTFGPLNFDVDASTGEATINVGGANITIDLW
jgi:hypothetical protein